MNNDQFKANLAAAKESKRKFDEMRRAVEAAPDSQNGTAWMDDLLSVPEQLSPRLAWMKTNAVETHPPGWQYKPSAKLIEWLSARNITLSPPLEGVWDGWAVCDDSGRVGEGGSISDALQGIFRHGENHPPEAGIQCAGWGQWSAVSGCSLASGATEDDAIAALAVKLGIRLWNENTLPVATK